MDLPRVLSTKLTLSPCFVTLGLPAAPGCSRPAPRQGCRSCERAVCSTRGSRFWLFTNVSHLQQQRHARSYQLSVF